MNITPGAQEGVIDAAGPSAGDPARRFTLRDGMILVAASALSFVMVSSLWRISGPSPTLWQYANSFLLFGLVALTPAVLALRLIRPRPTVQKLCRQTGFAALLISSVIMSITFIILGSISLALWIKGRRLPPLPPGGTTDPFWWANLLLNSASEVGPAVVAGWVLLVLSGRRRPGRDWLEFAGRAIGTGWIIFFLINRYWSHWHLMF